MGNKDHHILGLGNKPAEPAEQTWTTLLLGTKTWLNCSLALE